MSETLIVPRKESALSLASALISGRLQPNTQWSSPGYRLKFFLRGLWWPVATWRHLHNIASHPTMLQGITAQPTLPGKIHRPWLHQGLSADGRGRALRQHYSFAARQCPRWRNALLSPTATELVNFSGKEGENFSVTMMCNGRCEREGEVVMTLSGDDIRLAMITFAVTEQGGNPLMVIGGVQGAHSDTPHEKIRDATKSCHGLFPKRLLLEVAILFAQSCGISRVQGVSDSGHTYNSLRYRLKKRALFHASYDEFWQSMNAWPVSESLWQLTLPLARKPLEEVVSKKRAEYRRRYTLLDDIATRMASAG